MISTMTPLAVMSLLQVTARLAGTLTFSGRHPRSPMSLRRNICASLVSNHHPRSLNTHLLLRRSPTTMVTSNNNTPDQFAQATNSTRRSLQLWMTFRSICHCGGSHRRSNSNQPRPLLLRLPLLARYCPWRRLRLRCELKPRSHLSHHLSKLLEWRPLPDFNSSSMLSSSSSTMDISTPTCSSHLSRYRRSTLHPCSLRSRVPKIRRASRHSPLMLSRYRSCKDHSPSTLKFLLQLLPALSTASSPQRFRLLKDCSSLIPDKVCTRRRSCKTPIDCLVNMGSLVLFPNPLMSLRRPIPVTQHTKVIDNSNLSPSSSKPLWLHRKLLCSPRKSRTHTWLKRPSEPRGIIRFLSCPRTTAL